MNSKEYISIDTHMNDIRKYEMEIKVLKHLNKMVKEENTKLKEENENIKKQIVDIFKNNL